jgi:hypothetical protein|tara:strand:- start:354 stop:692 length:339 start_codon:yes stop_codon:yes gene_type:complete
MTTTTTTTTTTEAPMTALEETRRLIDMPRLWDLKTNIQRYTDAEMADDGPINVNLWLNAPGEGPRVTIKLYNDYAHNTEREAQVMAAMVKMGAETGHAPYWHDATTIAFMDI